MGGIGWLAENQEDKLSQDEKDKLAVNQEDKLSESTRGE